VNNSTAKVSRNRMQSEVSGQGPIVRLASYGKQDLNFSLHGHNFKQNHLAVRAAAGCASLVGRGYVRSAKTLPGRLIEIGAEQKEFTHMMMQEGEHWICSNSDCRCEVVVAARAGGKEGRNPTCSCGFAMRKRYSAPIFTGLRI
jgi:hypothetical protein